MMFVSATAFAKPPKWTQKVHWEDSKYDYFVGTSSKAASEEVGRREAYDNAMAEAIQALFGISGRMDLASYANLQKIQISQDVFVSTDEVQLKSEPIDLFVEKTKEGGKTLYNVWRSLKVDKKASKDELQRLRALADAKKSVEAKVVAPDPDLIGVSVEGNAVILNEDEPSAKANAIQHGIRKSCERLMQEWFYSKTLTDNYPKLNSLIYNRCSTFSKNYDIKSGYAEENIYKVDMTVYLKSGELRRRLMDAGLYRQRVPQRTSLPQSVGDVETTDTEQGIAVPQQENQPQDGNVPQTEEKVGN